MNYSTNELKIMNRACADKIEELEMEMLNDDYPAIVFEAMKDYSIILKDRHKRVQNELDQRD